MHSLLTDSWTCNFTILLWGGSKEYLHTQPKKGSCILNDFCWKDRTCLRIKMSFLHWPKPCALFKEIQIKFTVQKTEHFLHLWSMSQNTWIIYSLICHFNYAWYQLQKYVWGSASLFLRAFLVISMREQHYESKRGETSRNIGNKWKGL